MRQSWTPPPPWPCWKPTSYPKKLSVNPLGCWMGHSMLGVLNAGQSFSGKVPAGMVLVGDQGDSLLFERRELTIRAFFFFFFFSPLFLSFSFFFPLYFFPPFPIFSLPLPLFSPFKILLYSFFIFFLFPFFYPFFFFLSSFSFLKYFFCSILG